MKMMRENMKTYHDSTVIHPLPQLHPGNLSGSGVFHQMVDGNTSISRYPSGAIGKSSRNISLDTVFGDF